MSEKMLSHGEREVSGDVFRKLEAALTQLRASASAPAESWIKRTSAEASARRNEFNLALVDMLTELVSSLRDTVASQEVRLEQMGRALSELRTLSESLDAIREHSDHLEAELRSGATNVRGLQERSAALETELAQARQEQSERIQQVLDEQRVCIRQLSLQASEEAVLADRARRATELKLEELARRVPQPPA